MMLHKLIDEVEQESFDVNDFVERMTWRASGAGSTSSRSVDNSTDFNAQIIHDGFNAAIRQLMDLSRKHQEECTELQKQMEQEEVKFIQSVNQLIDRNKDEFEILQRLDEKISFVSTKVTHLGDQLQAVNVPRCRGQRALSMMKHLDAFSECDGPDSIFNDKKQLLEGAEAIQTLYLISRELTLTDFQPVRQRIATKYDEIERQLIERFVYAQERDDRQQMKALASMLSHFNGYGQCVDAFIEHSIKGIFVSSDPFSDVVPACEGTEALVHLVFPNPSHVMCRFILSIFQGKLQEHVQKVLSEPYSSVSSHLDLVSHLYSLVLDLNPRIARFDLGHMAGGGDRFLHQLTVRLFKPFVIDYITRELGQLTSCCEQHLSEYYNQCGHQRRQLHGGLGELRREAAAVIGTKTTINIASADNFGGKTFISEELTINLLQESQRAFKRCLVLSAAESLASNAFQIFEIISNAVFVEHIEYAIELSMQAIPMNEPRSEPQLYFYDIIRQTNGLVHLMEKHYADCFLPLVSGNSCESEGDQRRHSLLSSIEQKLSIGLERTISAACAWCRVLLQTEQRVSDFRPDNDHVTMTTGTQACKKVVRYVNSQLAKLKDSCDGHNLELVLLDFGERLHRLLVDHLLQFQYNTAGAMSAVFDVNEYKKCIEHFQNKLLVALFDKLHTLCNLMLVPPENLHDVISQTGVDKSIVMSFIQLRVDFKTARLAALIHSNSK